MRCLSCGHDNLPGTDHCENCHATLMQEDVPVARIRSSVERSLSEDRVETLHPVKAVSVPEDTTLLAAIRTMRERRIGCLLITDRDGRLSGILTERDLLNRVAGKVDDLSAHPVSRFMTRDPEVIHGNPLLASALQRMMVGDLRHLPLVGADGRPDRILSSRDIINYGATLVEGVLEPDEP